MKFDGKAGRLELFEDLFHTMIEMQPEMTELMKYVKPESQATAKHKWDKLGFDPDTMKLPDFLEELNQGAEKAFGENAQSMINSLLYAKIPPKLKRAVNMTRLENGTFDEIFTHRERTLELNALEGTDDLPMATMKATSSKSKHLLSIGLMADIDCNYCKEWPYSKRLWKN